MNLRVSASMIKDILACERKAYYRINSPEEQEQTWQMAVGSIVHESLEKHSNDFDGAIALAEAKIKTTNLKRGAPIVFKSIVNYFENFTYLTKDTDVVEQYFKIPYEQDVNIVGKFDRITKEGVVIDWKTGYSVPTDISNDAQFILYEWAYQRMYGSRPKRMFYVSLPNLKIVPYEHNDALVKEFFNTTLPYVIALLKSNIATNSFVRTGLFGYKVCDNCSFSNVCYKEIGL